MHERTACFAEEHVHAVGTHSVNRIDRSEDGLLAIEVRGEEQYVAPTAQEAHDGSLDVYADLVLRQH